MKKSIFKLISLISALTMLISSAAGCRKNPSDSSSDMSASDFVSSDADSSADSNSSGTDSAQSGTSDNSGTTGSKTEQSNDLKRFAGTTLTYAVWIDPSKDEGGPVLKKFEQATGMKVKIRLTSQDNYVQDVTSLIAAGNSPDMLFANGTFPSILSVLQPLDNGKLNLSDPIWDQSILEGSKVGGKSYLVDTVGSVWGSAICIFYNKKQLRDNNITTPEDYYKQGKWTFAAMKKVMSDVAKLGSDYIGGWIWSDSLLGAAGTSFYEYQNGTFVNGTDAKLRGTEKLIAECIEEGLMKDASLNGRDDFIDGKMGLVMLEVYGCKKAGYWKTMNPNHVGFCYAPRYDESSEQYRSTNFRGYGIAKGSKNPEATGVLLRYFLDVNNYDLKSTFISTEAQNFFFKVTADTQATPFMTYLPGVINYVGTINDQYLTYQQNIFAGGSAQVNTKIDALQNVINTSVTKVNNLLSDTAKQYK